MISKPLTEECLSKATMSAPIMRQIAELSELVLPGYGGRRDRLITSVELDALGREAKDAIKQYGPRSVGQKVMTKMFMDIDQAVKDHSDELHAIRREGSISASHEVFEDLYKRITSLVMYRVGEAVVDCACGGQGRNNGRDGYRYQTATAPSLDGAA